MAVLFTKPTVISQCIILSLVGCIVSLAIVDATARAVIRAEIQTVFG
jgi:hypothetical protein